MKTIRYKILRILPVIMLGLFLALSPPSKSSWWVVKTGQVTEDVDTVIKKVKRLPARYRNFPNDYAEITVDSFEKGLYFNTNSAFEIPDALSRE